MSDNGEFMNGDIVRVTGQYGDREGMVVGTSIDYAGRPVVQVQLEPGVVHEHWFPTVTRVKRTISYTRPKAANAYRTVERTIYW